MRGATRDAASDGVGDCAPGSRPAAWARCRAGLALCLLAFSACGEPPVERPNLLLLTVDSLRADELACYGGPPGQGQSLCRIATPGTRFLWAFAAAPAGAPAIASVLSSLSPGRHGVRGDAASFLRSEVLSLAEILAAEGYRCAAVVSSPELNRSRNLDQGFHVWEGSASRDADTTVDVALAWLARAPRPWLLWLHLGDLHGPFPPPPIDSYEAYRVRYRERLRALDTAVGRLLATVEEHSGARLATAALATHGESMGEMGAWFRHGHALALEVLRVPLLWRPLGAAVAEVTPEPVSAIDVAPSLLAEAGIAAPEAWSGRKLPNAADPPDAPGPSRAAFAELGDTVAVATGREFYVRGRFPRIAARLAVLPDDGGPARFDPDALRTRGVRIDQLETRILEHRAEAAAPRERRAR